MIVNTPKVFLGQSVESPLMRSRFSLIFPPSFGVCHFQPLPLDESSLSQRKKPFHCCRVLQLLPPPLIACGTQSEQVCPWHAAQRFIRRKLCWCFAKHQTPSNPNYTPHHAKKDCQKTPLGQITRKHQHKQQQQRTIGMMDNQSVARYLSPVCGIDMPSPGTTWLVSDRIFPR